jgi:hypothetical protein
MALNELYGRPFSYAGEMRFLLPCGTLHRLHGEALIIMPKWSYDKKYYLFGVNVKKDDFDLWYKNVFMHYVFNETFSFAYLLLKKYPEHTDEVRVVLERYYDPKIVNNFLEAIII